MKKQTRLISSITSFFINLLKRIKTDNFIAGLIFGAIFSLVVNVFTVQFQEKLNAQRYYEALEQELILQFQRAKNVLHIVEGYKEEVNPEAVSLPLVYDTNIWEEGSAISYLQRLPYEEQAALNVYYSSIIDYANSSIKEKKRLYEELYTEYWLCISKAIDDCSVLQAAYKAYFRVYLFAHEGAAEMVHDGYLEVRKKGFHPTEDRMNSMLFRIMMGTKSMPILNFDPKTNIDDLKLNSDFSF